MGSKLLSKERNKSYDAVHRLLKKNKWTTKFDATVLAEKEDEIFFNSKVEVVVSDNLDYYLVNISWEDGLGKNKDYHKLGLFGYYSTDYCKMKYNNETLVIHSDEKIKITIIW